MGGGDDVVGGDDGATAVVEICGGLEGGEVVVVRGELGWGGEGLLANRFEFV